MELEPWKMDSGNGNNWQVGSGPWIKLTILLPGSFHIFNHQALGEALEKRERVNERTHSKLILEASPKQDFDRFFSKV